MKKIYGEGAISLIPCSRGFIFTAQQDELPDKMEEQKTEGKTVIAYKQHSFDDGTNSLVTRSVFLMSKFGANFEFYFRTLGDYLNCKAIPLENGNMLIAAHDGTAAVFSRNNVEKWSGSLKHKGFAPADIVTQGDFLWCSYPENNAIIKYNINSMQQTFRVGGSASGGIIEPYGLWLNDNRLVITSSANGMIRSLNLDTFYLDDLWEVSEPAFQYIKVDSNEVVLTKSGIYRL